MGQKIHEKDLLAYSSFMQIIDNLQHYNRIQVAYRLLASTWLLASFFGIGYSLSSYEVNLPFNPLITVALICVGSCMGIFLIWYMDLIVCERFIATIVYQGIDLEKQNAWLPQILHSVNQIRSWLGYVNSKLVFYIGCFAIILIALGTSISIFLSLKNHYLWIAIPFLTILTIVVMIYLLLFSTKKTDPYIRLKTLKKNHHV